MRFQIYFHFVLFYLLGNEIQKVEGLDGLHDLRELVLDRNRIKNVTELSFANQWNLQELHMEENRIRDLANISCLDHLQRLYLGSNRIQVKIFRGCTAHTHTFSISKSLKKACHTNNETTLFIDDKPYL